MASSSRPIESEPHQNLTPTPIVDGGTNGVTIENCPGKNKPRKKERN
jgi:hypothetical protein